MKKKGLIIATIVMVLVLAVSLTTATYAWFSTEATSKIEKLTLSVQSGTDVLIGLTTTGSYYSGATTDNFVSGDDCSWNGTAWSSTTPSLGLGVNTNLSLNSIERAVSTASTNAASYNAQSTTIDAANAQLTGTYFIAANGNNTTIDTATIEDAIQNGWTTTSEPPTTYKADYLHFTLGLLANKATVDTVTLHITIDPTDSKQNMGITSALHVIYKIDGTGSWTNIDVGGNSNSYATAKTTVGGAAGTILETTVLGEQSGTTALHAGWQDFTISFGDVGTALGTTSADIHQVEIYIYYVGTDGDCRNDALIGSAADVYFNVKNTNTAA